MASNVTIGIGIPLSWQYLPADFFFGWLEMDKMNGHAITSASGPIDEMRNNITVRALELKCTHLVFLDADMVFPPDTIPRLVAHDKDIVGAFCCKRYPPFNPTIYVGEPFEMTLMDPYPEGLVEVTATGTGCLMIKTEVFENIEYPWWEFTRQEDGSPVGEDIGFCYRAKKAGYKVHVDTTIKTDHLTQMRANENIWKLSKSLKKAGAKFSF